MTSQQNKTPDSTASPDRVEQQVADLLARMTLNEKIGQMNQVNSDGPTVVDDLRSELQAGGIGSVLNEVNVDTVNALQAVAVEESRLGIPLLIGRDVIHGFNTVMPIPLGQAASWNPRLAQDCSQVAAAEAAAAGVNWTFAPMIDLTRDPRWGRIAESLGEDAHLASVMGVAMVRGFQGEDLRAADTIAACAKHFAGYGAAESGRDYATTDISEHELRNYYLRPFHAAVQAGVCTLMAAFNDLNGVPASANEFLMRRILRDEWGFDGMVVSDWDSIAHLSIHGLTEDERASALAAARAGVDMEMVSRTYVRYLPELIEQGHIDIATVDAMVANVLRTKVRLGLFERPYTDPDALPKVGHPHALKVARQAALQSIVMLKNEGAVLPLKPDTLSTLAIIGPLADAPYEQLGTWIFDGDERLSVTPATAIAELLQDTGVQLRYCAAMETSRSLANPAFDEAARLAGEADAALLFLGEEAILSGEAHSRADINLPGDQAELVRRVRAAGKPVIAVIMAGRPLTLSNIVDQVDAILYAWHPGTMGGAAIADLLFGIESPSAKLPVTFPRMVGQVPIYYNQKNTGKPPTPETVIHIDDIEVGAAQTSLGMTAFHLDAGYQPLYPFGHGLSYASVAYSDIAVSPSEPAPGDTVVVSARVRNTGSVAVEEVVQLYLRDPVASVTRPVKELKDFRRVPLAAGQSLTVRFEFATDSLGFYGQNMQYVTEAGEFQVWIGGSSEAALKTGFRLIQAP